MLKRNGTTVLLAVALAVLSVVSLFIGVLDMDVAGLLDGNAEQIETLLISRLPRLLAIICTGMGMSVAGLIMQQLCMNKFVSPTTGATISSAQFGVLLALLFMPSSTIWSRALFAFGTAIAGTVISAFIFANHFNIVGMGRDFSENPGIHYNLILFMGLTIAALITASVVVVGSISYIGLIVPNVVAMYKGDKIRGTLMDTALFGAVFVLVCDMLGRLVISHMSCL